MAKQRAYLESKTENQTNLIRNIYDNDVVICTGPSGCGKTMVSCGVAAKMLQAEEVQQIVITRPLICTGREIGALKGTLEDKIMPYLRVCEEYLKLFLGGEVVRRLVDNENIRYLPLELMRGSTFHNAFMILDEAQNCTFEQIKMFLTRMGLSTKCVVNGDLSQIDLRDSGLEYVKDKLDGVKGVGISEFNMADIQRNGIIGRILTALEK